MARRLEVGSRGTLQGRSWLILARLTFTTARGEWWDEYLLAHGNERRWLSFEDDLGRAYLWREVVIPGLARPEQISSATPIVAEGQTYHVDECGTKTLGDIDGDPEEDLESGAAAAYAEGHGESLRLSIEGWDRDRPVAWLGKALPEDTAHRWSKPTARSPRPRRQVLKESTTASGIGGVLGVGLFAVVLLMDGCWREDECRFYRENGTSYTDRCSHRDSLSVRSESTGRRIGGFGK